MEMELCLCVGGECGKRYRSLKWEVRASISKVTRCDSFICDFKIPLCCVYWERLQNGRVGKKPLKKIPLQEPSGHLEQGGSGGCANWG